MNQTCKLSTCLLFLCSLSLGFAADSSLKQTQSKLRLLDTQIKQIKQTLANAQNKHEVLDQELSANEKKIGDGVRQLRSLQQEIEFNQKKIQKLQVQFDELNSNLQNQQSLLAKHIRIRYQMGEFQPLKWILNQDSPHTLSRLLTFHQYIVQSRQQIIAEIDATKKNISANQSKLKEVLHAKEQLKQNLNDQQHALERNKHYHRALLSSLDDEIENKQLVLSEFERNKANLAHLLEQLSEQSVYELKEPFTQMRKKLPKPVSVESQNLQKMNQGLTFFAGEGTPVTAVYSGKVVFSDWLKGYGLLLIVDHGQGYMTLYAHNQSLFKVKGSTVTQGEQIASVGHSGGLRQNGLYFEVRHRGKAIPPLDWIS